MADQTMWEEFRTHEKEFVGFKATTNTVLNSMQEGITAIQDMLKEHFRDSGEHENAQAIMLADLNNRMIQQEGIVDKETIENLKQNVNTLQTERGSDRRWGVILILIGTLIATLFSGSIGNILKGMIGGG